MINCNRLLTLFVFSTIAVIGSLGFNPSSKSQRTSNPLAMSSTETVPEIKVGDTIPSVVLSEGQVRVSNL